MDLKDELGGLKKFLEAIDSPNMELRWNGEDVKEREVAILKREISHLEKLLADPRIRNA